MSVALKIDIEFARIDSVFNGVEQSLALGNELLIAHARLDFDRLKDENIMALRRFIVLTALLASYATLGLGLTACGQRGPLYLPPPGQPQAEEPAPVVPKRKSELPS